MPIPNNIKCNPLKLKIIEVNAFKQAKKDQVIMHGEHLPVYKSLSLFILKYDFILIQLCGLESIIAITLPILYRKVKFH